MLKKRPFGGVEVVDHSGPLAIYPPAFHELASLVRGLDMTSHLAALGRDEIRIGDYQIVGQTALIYLHGTMTKNGQSLNQQMPGGMVGVRMAIRRALGDDHVDSILLHVDSPGGTVAGTGDLADDFFRAGRKKRTLAYVEDMAASAGYYVACQAGRLIASPNSLVGSIGVYMVVDDWAKFYEQKGVKAHVIRAGAMKGAGTEGTEITPEQLADFQRVINELNEQFAAAVERGRRVSRRRVAEWNDGRIHGAAQALSLGLVDALGTLDFALQQLDSSRAPLASSTPADAPPAATTIALRERFPNSTAEFRERCLEKGWTLAQAKDAWLEQVEAENQKLREDAEREKAKAEAQAKAAGCGKTVDHGAAGDGKASADVEAEWEEAVAAEMKGNRPRHEAVRAAAKKHPALRAKFEAEHNVRHGREWRMH